MAQQMYCCVAEDCINKMISAHRTYCHATGCSCKGEGWGGSKAMHGAVNFVQCKVTNQSTRAALTASA